MGTNGSNEVTMSAGEEAEGSDTTVEIKIKTLDSQTYTLRVNKRVPVPALKEQIATVTGVLTEQQRLICRGKVLKDDQLLSAYHVEDGHTLHLVVRQPILSSSSPSTGTIGSEGASDHPAHNSPSSSTLNSGNQVAHSFVFEAVNIDQGDHTIPGLSRFISSILNSIGTASTRSGNGRSDLRETGSDRLDRASADTGLSDSNHPQPSFAPRRAAFRFPSASNLGIHHPAVIPDSLTTINQYLDLMRDNFRREGFTANGREHSDNEEASGMHENEEQNHDFQSHPVPERSGLPTLASLAEIVLSTRELLIEQAGGCLSQLGRQLVGQASVTDPLIRSNIQTSAIRFGALLQNLGSLLLELGRTTMTLHTGQTPLEAVVNAGPAVFISASGPNPMMVQPLPFHPGSSFGGVHVGSIQSSHGPEGHAIPVGNVALGEQVGAQQAQDQIDPARNSPSPNFVHPSFPGASGSASFTGESGVRVVPIRRVVAVPAGVNHSPSDSGNPVGLLYPVIARIQQLNPGNVNGERGSQVSTEPHPGRPEDQQPIRDGNQIPTNSVPVVSGLSPSVNESAQFQGSTRVFIASRQRPPATNNNNNAQAHNGPQSGQGSATTSSIFEQWLRSVLVGEEANVGGVGRQDLVTGSTDQSGTIRNAYMQGAPTVSEDQGILFSNLVRQLMPYISQGTATGPAVSPTNPSSSTAQTERENLMGSSSSQERRDPPEAPNTKRPKME